MELQSFGAVMKFAIDRETGIKTLLDEAQKNEKLLSIREKISEMAAINSGNLKLLERTRREGVCEMVLHPIAGLDANDYLFSSASAGGLKPDEFLALIENISGKIVKFYSDAACKLPADDAKRAFQKLAKKKYF